MVRSCPLHLAPPGKVIADPVNTDTSGHPVVRVSHPREGSPSQLPIQRCLVAGPHHILLVLVLLPADRSIKCHSREVDGKINRVQMVQDRGGAGNTIRVHPIFLTQQGHHNPLNGAIGTTHCCLKAYRAERHLPTVPYTHVVRAMVTTRTLIIRTATWKTLPLIAVGALKVRKIGDVANARPIIVTRGIVSTGR